MTSTQTSPVTSIYPSVSRPWERHYSQEALAMPLSRRSVYDSVWQNNKEHLKETALMYYGVKISYQTMFLQIEKTARALKAMGVGLGDHVLLCMNHTPEAVYLVLALNRIGAAANLINPVVAAEQKLARIKESSAKALFVMDKMLRFVQDVLPKVQLPVVVAPATQSLPFVMRQLARLKDKEPVDTTGLMPWKAFLQKGRAYAGSLDCPYEEGRPAVIVYSSGTTGDSKGIVLTNDGINATSSLQYISRIKTRRQELFLTLVPLWFSTGIVASLFHPLMTGLVCILQPVFSPSLFPKLVDKYQPNHTIIATAFWKELVKTKYKRKHDLSNFINPITGGDRLTIQAEKSIQRFLRENNCSQELLKGYGMCELGSTVSVTFDGLNKRGAAGLPLPQVIISTFDEETHQEMPIGQRGELRVISPCAMKEYYQNPEATQAYFHIDEEGRKWGRTGDMGFVDEEGYVHILGRMNDSCLTSHGEKVYLFDVEGHILANEAVEDCEVVNTAAPGQPLRLTAHLILSDEQAKPSIQDLVKQLDQTCRKALPQEAVPVGYKLYKTFQVKPSGKRDMEILAAERKGFHGIRGGMSWEGALPDDQTILRFEEENRHVHPRQQAI